MSCAYAADVHDQDVTIEETTAPLPDPIAAGAIANVADGGNVFSNTLTINAWQRNMPLTAYGGYTIGNGNVTNNTLLFTGSTKLIGSDKDHHFYGGYAGGTGNAIGNKVTLRGIEGRFTAYGGYAVQGRAAMYIERIEGSYSNVVGLPLHALRELAREAGVSLA